MPAQVAVALSPAEFLTSSKTGFVASDEKTKRRRNEAINLLRRAGSPYAQIAKQRASKPGQKGSTFPWAETAAALHAHTGRRWLASEIAIIGAASPFPPAYTKKPGTTPFGSTSHPSELLAQARANSRNAEWWREQHEALCRRPRQSGVGTRSVVRRFRPCRLRTHAHAGEHAQPVRRTSPQHSPASRRTDCPLWLLNNRPVTAVRNDPELAALNQLRASAPSTAERNGVVPGTRDASASLPSLLNVARKGKWLKVDAKPAYR